MAFEPYWMSGLTPEMICKAESELGETPAVRRECLQKLNQIIKDEAGFHPCVEDSFLLRFLRARKFNVDRAFRTLKNYYSFRSKYSGTVTDLKPSQLKKIIEMDKGFISPNRDANGAGINVVFVGTLDLENASAYDFMAMAFLVADIGLETEATQVCGCSVVYDFRGTSFKHISHFSSPTYLSMLIKAVQDCWPLRLKAIHLVNLPSLFSITFNTLRLLLSNKLRDRIHIHSGNLKSLRDFFPPESLPKELGGYLGKKDFEEFRSIMFSKESLMEKINKYVYNGNPSPATYYEVIHDKD